MEYFLFDFIIENNHHYCIVYMDNKNGFIVENNLIKTFQTIHNAIKYCKDYDIFLQDEEVSICNIDEVLKRTMIKMNNEISLNDCDTILWFWNTIQDVAYSINEHFYGDENGEDNIILYVYNQLFYGTNPEAMREDGKLYYPKWDNEDLKIIKNVVEDGIRIIQKALGID